MTTTARLVACSFLLGISPLAFADGPPKPLKKPDTAWKMGGKSISKVSDEEITSALTTAVSGEGYKVGTVDSSTACVWEGRFIEVSKNGERYEVYFKRPWAQPNEECNPKEATGPADDPVSKNATREYDPKGAVVAWVAPKLGMYGKQETPEQIAKMTSEAKTLFAAIFKK
jgi:hypothetical protein